MFATHFFFPPPLNSSRQNEPPTSSSFILHHRQTITPSLLGVLLLPLFTIIHHPASRPAYYGSNQGMCVYFYCSRESEREMICMRMEMSRRRWRLATVHVPLSGPLSPSWALGYVMEYHQSRPHRCRRLILHISVSLIFSKSSSRN